MNYIIKNIYHHVHIFTNSDSYDDGSNEDDSGISNCVLPCTCDTMNKTIHLTVSLPPCFSDYEIGQKITDYDWNTQIGLNHNYKYYNYMITYDSNLIEKLNHLQYIFIIEEGMVVADIGQQCSNDIIIDTVSENKQQKYLQEQRYNTSKRHLNMIGLEIREDSTLCNNYIIGDDKFVIKHIIDVMSQMKYLYEYCDYKKFIEKAKKNGKFDKENVKKQALDAKSNGVYPTVFPWKQRCEHRKTINLSKVINFFKLFGVFAIGCGVGTLIQNYKI